MQYSPSKICRFGTPVLVLAFAALAIAGKPKKEKEPPAQPAAPGPALPSDLNEASMRVTAVDTIYQLDLSEAQLHVLRKAADGTASDSARTAPKGDVKLATAFADVNRALLDGKDDQQVAKLRNQLVELASGDDVHLDDEIHPTAAAWAKAPAVSRQLSAGQIAAYLASHADEVGDPVERMVAALPALHEATPSEAEPETLEISDEVGHLVAGSDDKRCAEIAGKVASWLKANHDVTDEDAEAKRAELEESARKVVGDVAPMVVLSHWIDGQTATLLSNPQLPQAITAVLAAKESKESKEHG